ncbi:MAG: hypothetical protein QW689_06690 [Nitrososphaerota archaeon]
MRARVGGKTGVQRMEVEDVSEKKLRVADLLTVKGSPAVIAVWDEGEGADRVAFAVASQPPALLVALGDPKSAPVATFPQHKYVSEWMRRAAEEGEVTLINVILSKGVTIPVALTVNAGWMIKAAEDLEKMGEEGMKG